jgi:hypothetical protein
VAQARGVVKRFFRAAVREAPEEIDALVRADAPTMSHAGDSRQRARVFWKLRLARLDYSSLSAQSVYRETDVETYHGRDVLKLRSRRFPAIAAAADDVLVRVPIAVGPVGRSRLFGDELWFLLRLGADGYKIVGMVEDFRMP